MSPPSSPSDIDRDDSMDEDIEALKRACMLTATVSGDVDDSDTESGGESSDTKDIDLLRQLQERFSLPGVSPPMIKPLRSLPMPDRDEDEEDDFETLRAIRMRFTQYESVHNDEMNMELVCLEEAGVVADGTTWKETPDILSKAEKYMTPSKELPTSVAHELHHKEDETCNTSAQAFRHSQFPKAAQNFVDALKKNRSFQKFIRRKLIEIEAKIEENKELRNRIKCLMDFQVACKRNMGRMLCQQKDPRIRLISMQKSSTVKTLKTSWKKVPVLCFGPAENSHVSKYKMVMKRFPVSLSKPQWSSIENENLVKGIKQQYQEMLILNSMNSESDIVGSGYSNVVPALSSSQLEVTPEKLRSFLPLVNWDRLASNNLPGHTGAECESRWINSEDPMLNRNPWTIIEDKKLLYSVQERGVYNWIDIANTLGTHRTPFQCLARYQRSLNPHILNRDWTDEEDTRLLEAIKTFGQDWQVVASSIEGRTGPQCSNRWWKSLNPERRKVGRWSVDEDKRLKVAVMLFEAKNWNKIAQFAPGRTQVQCRERWLNCLDPSLNLEPWTAEEDTKLLAAIAEHGHSWSKVATCVPPRTDSQCRRRWKVLLPNEVPLLQAAKKLKRTVLVSNFVDREGERPLLGPDDFKSLLVSHTAEDGNNKTVQKRTSRGDLPKNPRAKSKKSLEKNLKVDDTMNSSFEIAPVDPSLAPGVNSLVAENGSMKRTRKEKPSNNQTKKSRFRSRRPLGEKLTADGVNSSSGTVPGALALLPDLNSSATTYGSMKKRNKTSSESVHKKLRAKSKSSLDLNLTTDDAINSSPKIATAKTGSMKRTRNKTSSNNLPKKSRARSSKSPESNLAVDGMINSSIIAPSRASLQPCANSTTAENRSSEEDKEENIEELSVLPMGRIEEERGQEGL